MPKQKSRPVRWLEAVGRGEGAIADLQAAVAVLEDAKSELQDLKDEYDDWKSNLPENLESSPTAEKLEEIENLDLDSLDSVAEAVEEANDLINEAGQLDLPRGFGRD